MPNGTIHPAVQRLASSVRSSPLSIVLVLYLGRLALAKGLKHFINVHSCLHVV